MNKIFELNSPSGRSVPNMSNFCPGVEPYSISNLCGTLLVALSLAGTKQTFYLSSLISSSPVSFDVNYNVTFDNNVRKKDLRIKVMIKLRNKDSTSRDHI